MTTDDTWRTLTDYKVERRSRLGAAGDLSDYDASVSARATGSGILREWPPCTCGAAVCPDGGQRDAA